MKLCGRKRQLAGIILLCCISAAQSASAGNLTLNARWNYSRSDAEDSDNFRQIYQANYTGKASITDLIHMRGGLRYTRDIPDSGGTKDFLTPSFTLLNSNDIYAFSLNGLYNMARNSEGVDRDNWNWNSALASNWLDTVWPFLRVSFGQVGEKTDDNAVNTLRTSSGATADWAYLQWLRLIYNFSWSESENKNTDAQITQTSHYGKLSLTKSFYANRLNFSFDQTYQETDQESRVPVGDDGFALVPVTISQAMYEETDDPLTGPLTNDAFFLLTDSDQPPQTLTIDPLNDPMNIGLKLDFRVVDVVYLSTLEEISSYANDFKWDVYSSSNGVDWELIEADTAYVYDDFEQRFEFAANGQLSHRYLKFVADTSLLLPNQVTEIEAVDAFRKMAGDGDIVTEETRSKNYRTLFNVGYRMLANLRFFYNFSFDRAEDNDENTNDQINNSGGFNWSPHQYFSTRFNVNDFRIRQTDRPEEITRNYTLSLGSQPLDTLSLNFTFRRAEQYEDDERLRASHRFSIFSSAQLYEDLLATLTLDYTTIEEGDGNDSWGADLRLTAQLTPTLLFEMRPAYRENIDQGTENYGSDFVMNWRISELMFLNGSARIWWFENETQKNLDLTYGIAPNSRNRFTFNYSYFESDDVTGQSLRSSWNWIINRAFNFSLNHLYNINDVEDNSWSINAQLKYQFNNLSR
jgi:hypothetical protein